MGVNGQKYGANINGQKYVANIPAYGGLFLQVGIARGADTPWYCWLRINLRMSMSRFFLLASKVMRIYGNF